MVLTIVIIAGAWVQGHHGQWQPRLMGAGLLASVLGIFMSATRTNALILFALITTSMFTGKIKAGYRFRWVLLLAGGRLRGQRRRAAAAFSIAAGSRSSSCSASATA